MVKCGKKWALSKSFDSSNHDRGVRGVSNITMSVVFFDNSFETWLCSWLWLKFCIPWSCLQCGTWQFCLISSYSFSCQHFAYLLVCFKFFKFFIFETILSSWKCVIFIVYLKIYTSKRMISVKVLVCYPMSV